MFGSVSYWAQKGWTSPPILRAGGTRGPLDFILLPFFIVFGIVLILLDPAYFRRGAKWAWYVVAVVPLGTLMSSIYDSLVVFPLLGFVLYFGYGGPALLGLLLTYRIFFPKKEAKALV